MNILILLIIHIYHVYMWIIVFYNNNYKQYGQKYFIIYYSKYNHIQLDKYK